MKNKTSFFKIFSFVFFAGGMTCLPIASYALCPGVQLSLYGGGVDVAIKKTEIDISPFETDTVTKGHHHTSFTPAAGIAYNYVIAPNSQPILDSVTLALNYYYISTTHKGDVYQFENPLFDNFDYSMQLKSSRLMFDTEWNFQTVWGGIVIFGEAGAGAARNKVEYHDTPKPGIIGGGLDLPSHTQNKFAWEAGAGIKVPVPRMEKLLLSLRYLYTNLGTVDSATNGNFAIVEPIKFKPYAQSVLLGATLQLG